MNINFGLFPPLVAVSDQGRGRHQAARNRQDAGQEASAISRRALGDLALWIAGGDHAVAAE